MLTRVWNETEYGIDVCRISESVHIEHLWNMQKNWRFSLSIDVRVTMNFCAVFVAKFKNFFHGLMNNPVLYRHSFGYGSYIIHQNSIDTCHTNTQFSIDIFLLVNMDYLQWLIVCWVGRPTKKLLEQCSIYFTLTCKTTKYMMGEIFSNSLWSRYNVAHVTRHVTVSVSISALSKVHNARCDFIIIHTRVIMNLTQCRYFLHSHSHCSRRREE
jgi:hypothetical protein